MEIIIALTTLFLAVLAHCLTERYARMALLENQLEQLMLSEVITPGACYSGITRFRAHRAHPCESCGKTHSILEHFSLFAMLWPCPKRSAFYLFMGEILFMAVAWLFWGKFGLQPWFFVFLALWFLFYIITIIDFRYFIIPDELNFSGIGLGVGLALIGEVVKQMDRDSVPVFLQGFDKIWNLKSCGLGILFSAGLLFVIAWLCSRWLGRDAMGGGDIKLIAMIGSIMGVQGAMFTLALSSIAGSLFGLGFLIKAKLVDKHKGFTMIAYGPYLILAALIVLFVGPESMARMYEEWSMRFVNLAMPWVGSAIM
jgi:prepilin signal peptidase PulO-like enzyme (type II secretory pathway)